MSPESEPRLALVIGNKNYSSWSMRPWVALRQADIPFREIQLWFDDNAHAGGVEQYSPTGQVPVLLVDQKAVWDSLAICETAAELFPEKRLWPEDTRARAHARAVCAEMHAGFRNLRGAMLFGRFTIADAYFAPVVMRFITYGVSLPQPARDYVGAVRELSAVAEWMAAAKRETAIVAADEPYAARS